VCSCAAAFSGAWADTQAVILACILGWRLRNWRWWLWCWLLRCQAQLQGEAGPCWKHRPPEVLEQLWSIDLMCGALPFQQLWYVLVGVKVPVNAGWQLSTGFDPANSTGIGSVRTWKA
jgi:hypothetical protein